MQTQLTYERHPGPRRPLKTADQALDGHIVGMLAATLETTGILTRAMLEVSGLPLPADNPDARLDPRSAAVAEVIETKVRRLAFDLMGENSAIVHMYDSWRYSYFDLVADASLGKTIGDLRVVEVLRYAHEPDSTPLTLSPDLPYSSEIAD